jgi:type IV pilus assembly protein PilQ
MSSMLGSITDRFRIAGMLSLGVALAAIGVFACAGSTTGVAESSAQPSVIGDVVVDSDSGVSTVSLMGLGDAVFTAFQQTEPDRIVVDIAGVKIDNAMDPVAVYDGVIDEVAVSPFTTDAGDAVTRVEVSLATPADYKVRPMADKLQIEVSTSSEMAASDADQSAENAGEEAQSDPWAVAPKSDSDATAASDATAQTDAAAAPEAMAESAPMETHPATTLFAVEPKSIGDDLLIELKGDGSVESAVTFTLENPARLVVDLPGIKSQVKQSRVSVDSVQASSIRVGGHPDKVRVVIDAGSTGQPFSERQVIPTSSGLVVALGGSEALESAVAAAGAAPAPLTDAPVVAKTDGSEAVVADAPALKPAESAASADTKGIATIYGVEFDVQDERDRVVVLSENPIDYLMYEPDPETIVMSFQNAVIDPEAAVRIAPESGGPVSLVTAFAQPDVPRPEVRVVVKRAPNLKPEITRRGALLVMDFPRSGGLAATPPILEDAATQMAQAANQPDASAAASEAAELASAAPAESAAQEPHATASEPLLEPAPAALAPVSPAEPGPDQAAADAAAPGAIDAPASISILHEGGLMDGKVYTGRRISLDFKEVDIADVLRLIAEVSDLNVIAGDEVKGAVTIRLIDVPWDQALDVILLTKGLGFARIGNVLRIAASDVLAQEEELRLQERRSKEKLEDLVVKLQPVNYADVKSVSGMITQLLTERGSVNVDARTNTLILKDIPSVIDEATALVKAVDTMTPQVMIESKIVEASLQFSREFGISWGAGVDPVNTTLGGRDYVFNDPSQVVFGNPVTTNPTGILALAGTVLDSNFNYNLELQAAEINGDGKVISSPRVVTLDNSQAQIQQGVSIPFQTFQNGDAQLQFVDAVLKLKVTPHITSDKSIIMDIQVSRNAPDDSVFTLTGSPAIAKNEVKTETLVKDGQTLVLGGIYVVDKSGRKSAVPYLHKIPFLGMAFKSSEVSDSRKELLVFVTPRIVQTTEAGI